MLKKLAALCTEHAPQNCEWSLRIVAEEKQRLSNRHGQAEAPINQRDLGYMLTVYHQGCMAYAASSDCSAVGIKRAFEQGLRLCAETKQQHLFPAPAVPSHSGVYASPQSDAWHEHSLTEKQDLLKQIANILCADKRMVDSNVSLNYTKRDLLMTSSAGAEIEQQLVFIHPQMHVVAHDNHDTQIRSFKANATMRQGGWEQLEQMQFQESAQIIVDEALQLVHADDCPSGAMDLLLMPSQMVLQIHESIGHPLELDRILGDERNYAGTSFVTQDMFGSYQYGSSLLNVSFDPNITEQNASYAFDDEGTASEKVMLIENGILKTPLGGAISQQRAGMSGTANSRASSWNRPPLDRMSNINLECGSSSLEEMIQGIEYGVLMDGNRSWSIDDSRNKFQFGCEFAQIIKNGKRAEIVKNPNYRGISSSFWRNLHAVGDLASRDVMGINNCGKAEPNQVMYVGHASPPCVFKDVAVFGGAS